MRWFPAVGLIVGALVAGAGWAGARIDPWTGALAALILWVAVTGALHLDGLGDIADGSGGVHKDCERVLGVLGDPQGGGSTEERRGGKGWVRTVSFRLGGFSYRKKYLVVCNST